VKHVIGLIGKIGSGKTTVGKYLKDRYGASEHRFSTILSDILDRLYLPQRREYLQALGAALRANLGEDVIVNAFEKDLGEDPSEVLVVDGIRYENEVEMLKGIENSVLIYVDAPAEIRYERAVERGERGEAGISFEEFLKNDSAETEKRIESLKPLADCIIDNSGSLEELIEKLDVIMGEGG
jgi:dephospho-CoA kinase